MIVKLTIFELNFHKKVFPTKNGKIALVCASMDFSYYIKLFCSGSDRHNDILTSFLILVAEKISVMADILKIYIFSKIKSSQDDISIFLFLHSMLLVIQGNGKNIRLSFSVRISRILKYIYCFNNPQKFYRFYFQSSMKMYGEFYSAIFE